MGKDTNAARHYLRKAQHLSMLIFHPPLMNGMAMSCHMNGMDVSCHMNGMDMSCHMNGMAMSCTVI
jgi:hypothetical protein